MFSEIFFPDLIRSSPCRLLLFAIEAGDFPDPVKKPPESAIRLLRSLYTQFRWSFLLLISVRYYSYYLHFSLRHHVCCRGDILILDLTKQTAVCKLCKLHVNRHLAQDRNLQFCSDLIDMALAKNLDLFSHSYSSPRFQGPEPSSYQPCYRPS